MRSNAMFAVAVVAIGSFGTLDRASGGSGGAMGTLFGIDEDVSTLTSGLVIIDPNTGTSTVVGETRVWPVWGLAYDSNTDTLFAVSPGAVLLTIDPATGVATILDGYAPAYATSLAVDSGTGMLFATTIFDSNLYAIDPLTVKSTEIGSMGFADVLGLAFDPRTNVLYGVDNQTDQLITIDIVTGAGAAVGPLGFAQVEGLAFDPLTNTLYGTDAASDQLIAIDPVTGAGRAIGPLDATDVVGLAMLANCVAADFIEPEAGVSINEGIFDGYVDPRRESDNGLDVNQGLDVITVKFTTAMENGDGSELSADRFSIDVTGGEAPAITGISTEDAQTVTVELDRIIPVQQWTTVSVDGVRSVCDQAPFSGGLSVGYLPGDVDQSGVVTPLDLLEFRRFVNEVTEPEAGVLSDFIDMNRDGVLNPLDLLTFRRLINGIPPCDAGMGRRLTPAAAIVVAVLRRQRRRHCQGGIRPGQYRPPDRLGKECAKRCRPEQCPRHATNDATALKENAPQTECV